jgi:hypothetical protein
VTVNSANETEKFMAILLIWTIHLKLELNDSEELSSVYVCVCVCVFTYVLRK